MKRAPLLAAGLVLALGTGYWAGRSSAPIPGASRLTGVEVAPVGGLAAPSGWRPAALAEVPVRNLVLAVGDGMGLAGLAAARLRAYGVDGRFVWERFPVTGLVDVAPEGGLIPKSDSAATALATGRRTVNGRIALSAAGEVLPTLAERLSAAGWLTGLVTTSAIFDATPAAFAAHVARRRDYAAIADQLAASPLDLLAGGGVEIFAGGDAGRARLAAARARGVEVVTGAEALAVAGRLPLWALFPGRRLGEEPARPALEELTAAALRLLAAEGRARGAGFFLLIEEEGIDTAAHARDLDRLAAATVRFDRAVEHAARFAAADGATLVVVVGDHSTGGLAVDHRSTRDRLRVVWTSGEHTGEPVPIFAYGPPAAAARFGGVRAGAEVGRELAAAAGLGPS